jgi:hypothetical protein
MIPWGEKWGELYLPTNVAAQMSADVGVVISVGDKIRTNIEGQIVEHLGPETELAPGDMVLVRPYDGTWREDFIAGDYAAKSTVRTYGIWCPEGTFGETMLYDWSDSIPCKIDKNLNMQMLRNNLHVKRDPFIDKVGMLHLSEFRHYGSNIATVIEGGPLTKLKPGTRFIHDPAAMQDIDDRVLGPLHGIISEDSIELVLED